MKHYAFVNIDNIINSKEYNKLVSILKEYSIEPIKIERVRSVYKITTNGRIYCLKKMKHGGEDKVEKGMQLAKYLVSKSFYNVIRYIKTTDNKACIKRGRYTYYVTDWIKGRESNFDNFEELMRCVQLLADFHVKSTGFNIEHTKIINNTKKWPSILKKEKNELIEISEKVKNKKVKTSFDINYLELIPEYIEKINFAIRLLDDSSYLDISNKANISKSVCHDSFYYQNILVKNNNKMYIIDLDSSTYDINVYDLGKFIRRILFNSCYSWDFGIAKELIEAYKNIRPLSKEELEILLSFIIYPHKFWKLGKKRYVNGKTWTEAKYTRKLGKILRYKEKEDEFTEKYLSYFINIGVKKEE
jgi:CotS family spore coat protein